jgi:hypothetical protein
MRKLTVVLVVGTVALSATTSAYAAHDWCQSLATVGNYCGTFKYSSGGSNQYTATFSSGGNFTLNGSSTGTYTCDGLSFTEVDYAFGGFENQVWYGKVGLNAHNFRGYGKSTTNGYLYSFSLVPGTCGIHDVKPGQPQNTVR